MSPKWIVIYTAVALAVLYGLVVLTNGWSWEPGAL
jgi:hypothetical protein